MSDDAPTPAGDAGRDTWPAPASAEPAGPGDATPGVPLDKAAEGIRPEATPSDDVPLAEGSAPDPAPRSPLPTDDAQAGPGHPTVPHEPPTAATMPEVTSAATSAAAPPVPQSPFTPSWAAPGAPQPYGAFASFPPPDPATLAAGLPPHPFAPPLAPTGAVPPPPISPDGPGQVPYGHPGAYGYPAPAQVGYLWPGVPPVESNGIGVAGMVLGIASAVFFCLWPAAIVIGVLGVVFGAIGRRKASRGEATNPGQALAGVILGIAGIILGAGLGTLAFMIPV
ncbi:DUF4190 domain-containing protein [Streptomyces sp. YKOK-I1]